VELAFAASDVEEVDLVVQLPLGVGKGVVVSGDQARSTTRNAFPITGLRKRRSDLRSRLVKRRDLFFQESFRGRLGAKAATPR